MIERKLDAFTHKNGDGIKHLNIYGQDYIVWTNADVIKPYVIQFLKSTFPGKIVVRELNMIDLTVPEENLPIEIEYTITSRDHLTFSKWENDIRKQIEQNIINYDRCWFFFDSELFRAMQNARRLMSINMDWFRKYMKEEKLKVFTVSYDGIINELKYEDFDFLAEKSQTCRIASETDDMILNRNKMKIFTSVIQGYNFIQEEIDGFYNSWRNNKKEDEYFSKFLRNSNHERMVLYGNILQVMGDLVSANKLLGLDIDEHDNKYHGRFNARYLGIFDENTQNRMFVDKFDICKYFPGYIRNKDMWDFLKGSKIKLDMRRLDAILRRKVNPLEWKKLSVECGWQSKIKGDEIKYE